MRSCTASPRRYTNTGRGAYVPMTMQRQVPAVLRVRHLFPFIDKCWTFLLCFRDRYPRCNCACALLVWLVTMHLTLCSLLASPGPGCSASCPIWTRRTDSSCVFVDSWQWHVQSWFYFFFCTRAVSRCAPLGRLAPDARHHGRYGPQGQFGLVLLVAILPALCSLGRLQAQNARRYGPEGQLCSAEESYRPSTFLS